MRLFSCTVPKDSVQVSISLAGAQHSCNEVHGQALDSAAIERPAAPAGASAEKMVEVPLIKLAWGRSGDKGNKANVGIIARRAQYLPHIWASLDEASVSARFAHFLDDSSGSVERFLLPGSHAINFLLHDVLGARRRRQHPQ